MDAYNVMNEWDLVTGKERTREELDKEIPPLLTTEYEEWKKRLEARDIDAILEGMKVWGLPIGPLRPFEIDETIETMERPDLL
jgi:hypothetical protein